MMNDYLSFFNEFQKPIEFWFFMKEDYTVGDHDDPTLGPYIKSINLVPSCKIKAGDESFSLSEYKKHISTLSDISFREIQKEIFKVRNRKEFLYHIHKLILDNFKQFITDTSGTYRDLEFKTTFISSEFRTHPLDDKKLNDFYQPFFQVQYIVLVDFKNRFDALYANEIKKGPPKKKATIEFKYKSLYKNPKTSKDFKDSIEGFVAVLRDNELINNKTNQCFLSYFGLSNPPTKIIWCGQNQGDFFTIYRRLDDLKIVSGHNRTTLPNYINIKGVKWDQWNSMKHTKNRPQIEKIVDSFAKELEVLHTKYSAPNSLP